MIRINRTCLAGMVLVMTLLAGCTLTPGRLGQDYGTSYHSARQHQILKPEAQNNLEPAEGLDGKAARQSIIKYRETFEKPPPPPTFSISIGQ